MDLCVVRITTPWGLYRTLDVMGLERSCEMGVWKKPRMHFGVISTSAVEQSYPLIIPALCRNRIADAVQIINLRGRNSGSEGSAGMDLRLDDVVDPYHAKITSTFKSNAGPVLLTVFTVTPNAEDIYMGTYRRPLIDWEEKLVIIKHDLEDPSMFVGIGEDEANDIFGCVILNNKYIH